MAARSATMPDCAKLDTAASCGNRRRALRLNASVMQKSRDLFSLKTAQHLSEITGYSTRSCESWLSKKVVLPSDALAALMHSEWGREYLAAVMSDNTPRWWLKLKAWIAAVDLAAAEIKQRRKLRELLDDVASAPSAALLVSDPDFYSGQPYPPRALVRGKAR